LTSARQADRGSTYFIEGLVWDFTELWRGSTRKTSTSSTQRHRKKITSVLEFMNIRLEGYPAFG